VILLTFSTVVLAMSFKASRVKNAWCAVMSTLGNVNRRASTSVRLTRTDMTECPHGVC